VGRSYNSKIKVCPIVGSTDAALFMLTYAYTPTTVSCTTVVAGVNQNVNFSVNAGVSTQSFWPLALAAGGFGFVYVGTDSVVKLILATKSSTAYSWAVGSAQTLYSAATIVTNAMCASNGRNGRIFVSFPNTSAYPVNMQVSNFTATNGVTYITGSTNYTPATNYSLLGVALTTAAPGASGTVQTRGTAKLNAGYPAALTPSYFSYASSAYGPYGGNTGNVSGTTVTLGGL
jgi:predicted heme/steroid binding protein